MKHTKFYEVNATENAVTKQMHEHFINVFKASHILRKGKEIYKFSVDSDLKDDMLQYLNTLSKSKNIKVKITTDLQAESKFNELFEAD